MIAWIINHLKLSFVYIVVESTLCKLFTWADDVSDVNSRSSLGRLGVLFSHSYTLSFYSFWLSEKQGLIQGLPNFFNVRTCINKDILFNSIHNISAVIYCTLTQSPPKGTQLQCGPDGGLKDRIREHTDTL